jgi:hypothetical protein
MGPVIQANLSEFEVGLGTLGQVTCQAYLYIYFEIFLFVEILLKFFLKASIKYIF